MGDTWAESAPTFTQKTATLKILGGDADVDNFLRSTRSNVQDLETAVVQLKAKAVQQKFDDTFINGDVDSDVKAFDGIDKLATEGQTVAMGTNGATLTLEKLDELIDKVRAGQAGHAHHEPPEPAQTHVAFPRHGQRPAGVGPQ